MSHPAETTVAPGWYDDPWGSEQQRYWDGTQWTGEVLPAPGWFDDPWGSGQRRYWDGAQWTHRLMPPPPGARLPSGPVTTLAAPAEAPATSEPVAEPPPPMAPVVPPEPAPVEPASGLATPVPPGEPARGGPGRAVGSLVIGVVLLGFAILTFAAVSGDECTREGGELRCIGDGVETTINVPLMVLVGVVGAASLVGGVIGVVQHRARGHGPRPALETNVTGLLLVGYVTAVLLPLVGLVIGLTQVNRNRHGIRVVGLAVAAAASYLLLALL